MSTSPRRLIITADDFGIGPATSQGILDLAKSGIVTSTVLLVNSPFAVEGLAKWRKSGCPVEMGWHPCLSLDSPILSKEHVPSLVGSDGRFHSLGQFLRRLVRGKISEREVEIELKAQHNRYLDLVGTPPVNVNGHHHVHIFGMVGRVLRRILASQNPKPYLRRVQEPKQTLWGVPGARIKRLVLSRVGRRAANEQIQNGFAGAEELAGITDPKWVKDPEFFLRWLRLVKSDCVELTCHPGHYDETIIGRDGTKVEGNVDRRPNEWALLMSAGFQNEVKRLGFELVTAGQILNKNSTVKKAA